MKTKKDPRDPRYSFNVHLNQDEKNTIDELHSLHVNVSGVFKGFIRQYLEKIKKLEE